MARHEFRIQLNGFHHENRIHFAMWQSFRIQFRNSYFFILRDKGSLAGRFPGFRKIVEGKFGQAVYVRDKEGDTNSNGKDSVAAPPTLLQKDLRRRSRNTRRHVDSDADEDGILLVSKIRNERDDSEESKTQSRKQ
jgi:hypothetical protein